MLLLLVPFENQLTILGLLILTLFILLAMMGLLIQFKGELILLRGLLIVLMGFLILFNGLLMFQIFMLQQLWVLILLRTLSLMKLSLTMNIWNNQFHSILQFWLILRHYLTMFLYFSLTQRFLNCSFWSDLMIFNNWMILVAVQKGVEPSISSYNMIPKLQISHLLLYLCPSNISGAM